MKNEKAMSVLRKYTMVDLLRFHKFANDNPELKGFDKVRAYNKKHPELSEKQKFINFCQALNLGAFYKKQTGVELPSPK